MPNAAFIAAFGTNGKKITDTYDIIGRITKRRLGLSANYDTDITYIAGANGSKTALVGSYKNGGDAKYNYTYDANGNIIQIWRGDGTFASASEKYSYTYDAANQLIRENLYYGSGNSSNKTVTYEYDEWGNILRKLEYAYTTAAELAEPVANVVLSFNGNSPILGGTVPNLPSSISAAPGTTVTIPNVIMQLNCSPYIYEFVAWNTHSNGMGTTYRPGQSITLNSNVTLYAKWRLVYAPPGGGGIMGEAPDKPNEPERAVAPYPVKAYIYNYADSNWKDKLTSIETYTVNASGHMAQEAVMNLTYDAMGNPTSYIGATLSWNGKQLSSYTRAVGSQTLAYAYRYNEDGLRTQKIASMNGITAETTNYYYNGSVLMAMQAGNTVQRFSYDAQGKVVSVNYNGTEYYYLRNAQGDIVKLIDNNKNTVVEYTYDSWGKLISTTGSLATSLGANQPFRYRGYVYDGETGWYYLQSRYYDPNTCLFISSDVYLSTGQGVIGHNTYAYCGNNPINRIDSEGNFWNIVIGAAIGAVIGAVSSVVGQVASGQEINWGAVAVSAASGAVTGAINAACPCMGLVATGVVNGTIGAATHAATELAYGRTPTAEGVLAAGITSGVMAAASRHISNKLYGKACFIAGTLVLTCTGVKTIETITEGDYVYTTNPETGESGYKRVLHAFDKETYELIKVKVDGETITTTPTHPFYVPQKGWTEAVQLRAGDILVTCNGEYVVVEQVQHEILETPVTVYNFEVEDFHTYYVAADADLEFVLVHNSKCGQESPRSPQKS